MGEFKRSTWSKGRRRRPCKSFHLQVVNKKNCLEVLTVHRSVDLEFKGFLAARGGAENTGYTR